MAFSSLAEYMKVPPPCQERGTYQDKQDNLEERLAVIVPQLV